MYLSAKEVKEKYKITNQTLYNWRKKGQIKFNVLPSGRYMYYPLDSAKNERKNVIYARVSSTKQKNDLERQIQTIQSFVVSNGYKVDEIFSDIASGMNDERKSLNSLMDLVFKGEVETIFISYKDRLSRFGFNYFERIFSKFGTKIEVLNSTREEDFQSELTQDLISIIHHFSMKMYSSRRKKLKEFEKNLKIEDKNV